MQVAKPLNIVRKVNKTLSDVAKNFWNNWEEIINIITYYYRNTTCSGGWLRLVVQCIFGAITIISFVLIVYSTTMGTISSEPSRTLRCTVQSCRILCYYAPFFNEYEEDIFVTVSEASSTCDQLMVTLHDPHFSNATLPENWLSNMRTNIRELKIVGGNLRYFAPQSFVTPFAGQLRRLILENISIMQWSASMLTGLSNLKEIFLLNSYIINIERNALDAVDETLEVLSVTNSGYFDPVNLTGGLHVDLKVHTVILSSNNFNNILTRASFQNLKHCKVLYLNSCRISSLGEGTFDVFEEIEVLYLDDNFLVALPSGLFDRIMTITYTRPRISLQNNMWYCDCAGDLLQWVSEGILLADTTCYYPHEVRNQLFSDFARACDNKNLNKLTDVTPASYYSSIVRSNGSCRNNYYQSFISPIDFMSCSDSKNRLHEFIETQLEKLIKSNKNDLLKSKFAIKTDYLSMLEIATAGPKIASNYGLVWFQSECPDEIYCINTMPSYLRVYNIDDSAQYTFCPIIISTGEVYEEKCIFHNAPVEKTTLDICLQFFTYLITIIFCLTVGACIVYGVIRKFPRLLKGSDRIVFVKHKNVDALVLPPKVPLRLVNNDSELKHEFKNEIFTLSYGKGLNNVLVRSKSRSSTKSIAPSYISALQPTEEQLTEWRLRHHFDNDVASGFDLPYSLLSDDESIYCSITESNTKTYVSLK